MISLLFCSICYLAFSTLLSRAETKVGLRWKALGWGCLDVGLALTELRSEMMLGESLLFRVISPRVSKGSSFKRLAES